MNKPKRIATLLVLALFQMQLFSQEAITGNIPDWSLGSGEVVTGLTKPIVVGSVDQGGNFSISLKPDFMETIKKEVEAQDSRPSRALESKCPNRRILHHIQPQAAQAYQRLPL